MLGTDSAGGKCFQWGVYGCFLTSETAVMFDLPAYNIQPTVRSEEWCDQQSTSHVDDSRLAALVCHLPITQRDLVAVVLLPNPDIDLD